MKQSLLPLYLTEALRRLALSLLGLFSAIYIFKALGSLKAVFLFFLLLYTAKMLTNFLVEEISLRLGLRSQIFIGQLILLAAICFFLLSQTSLFLLFWAGILWGTSASFYWFGRHGLMAKMAIEGQFGLALGRQEMINLGPLLTAPILGGLLINFWGYQALFVTALVAVFLSLLTLWPLPNKKTHYDTTPAEIFRLYKTHKRMFLAYFGDEGSAVIYFIVFPLYLFLILQKELSLGGFFSLSLVVVAILNFLIGRAVDMRGKKELIGAGTVLSFLIWLGRVVSRKVGLLFFLDVAERSVEKMTAMPLNVLTYEKAIDGATGRALLFRETAMGLGAIWTCLMLWLISDLRLSFVLGAFLTLLPLLIIRKKGIYGEKRPV